MLGEPKNGTQNRKIGVFIWILLRKYRKNTFFDVFSQISSLRTKTTKEKVDQDDIWNFLNKKKYSSWSQGLGYDAKMTSKMTSFGQF